MRQVRRWERASGHGFSRSSVSGGMLLRRRFTIGDRAFTVLGEPWFDVMGGEWSARIFFVPLDHSLTRCVVSEPLARGRRRDDVVRQLAEVSDRAILRAFRSIALPLPRRTRAL